MSILSKQSHDREEQRLAGIFHAIASFIWIFILVFVTSCSSGDKEAGKAASTQPAGMIQTASPAVSSTPVPSLSVSNATSEETTTPSAELPPGVSITFPADEDATVKQAEPDVNFGGEKSLSVDDGDKSQESYIRFTAPELPGAIQSAHLRLYTGTNGSTNGPAVYTTDLPWSEMEITWNNRPAHGKEELSNKDQLDPASWVEYDVTSLIKGRGAYTFILVADSGDAVAFSSREGKRSPELVVIFTPSPTPTLAADDAILVGAGEVSICSDDDDELTARLLDNIPGTIFTAGNNVYKDGTYQEFIDCYGPTWGRHKDRTYPVPGNHEYRAQDANGYFQYFNNIPSYYAYDLGKWRIYALNSEVKVGDDSKQLKWLKIDLATHPAKCVLAYWHAPRWSSGSTHGNGEGMQALWQTLYDAGAELVLNGFEHNYERFMPMNANGQPDPQGLREIVVGTGGANLYPFGEPLPTSEVRDDLTYGVLKLTLHASSYDWQFIPVEGSTFTDSGSAECH